MSEILKFKLFVVYKNVIVKLSKSLYKFSYNSHNFKIIQNNSFLVNSSITGMIPAIYLSYSYLLKKIYFLFKLYKSHSDIHNIALY